jgi:predicted nucleotidyltransferase
MAARSYPTFAETRARRLARRRADVLRHLRRAEAVARAAGGQLLVFGSLVEGRFHERSDIDVALMGLPEGRDSEVAAEIDTLLALAGIEADVIPERHLGASLRKRVLVHGREPSALV